MLSGVSRGEEDGDECMTLSSHSQILKCSSGHPKLASNSIINQYYWISSSLNKELHSKQWMMCDIQHQIQKTIFLSKTNNKNPAMKNSKLVEFLQYCRGPTCLFFWLKFVIWSWKGFIAVSLTVKAKNRCRRKSFGATN